MPDKQEFFALEHIIELINHGQLPELGENLKTVPGLSALHEQLVQIREILFAFSSGDLSQTIKSRGFIAGCLKSLQAHLRHMVWQVKQVEQGDFTQRVEFLGEFSDAFNNMVIQLHETLDALQKKEHALEILAANLRNEVSLRNEAMDALKESETRFKYMASHDPLTGALNRRSFLDRALAEFEAAAIRRIPCCLAIMDIDLFKIFNDTYGHLAGDAILQHVVRVISQVLRKSDFMGRYGGEEFIFLFCNSTLETTGHIVERIRETIASSPLAWEGRNLTVTASFGVSVAPEGKIPQDQSFIDRLITIADAALYKAKKDGRNRVVCQQVNRET
ncbi:MAG: GGDEF domain-containing protein [Spirochaetaceae bacterium]|jgi:diguanylate cyclase (GGDEF)-like protein|nr:GGDEF domain-containing protein [Spirochaetaceae bacterium]